MKKKNLIYFATFLLLLGVGSPGAGAQTITTFAGCGIGNDSLALNAELVGPVACTFDPAGNFYIADAQHFMVRKVNTSGVITTFAGNGFPGYFGDGGPATAAELSDVYGLVADGSGNLFLCDNGNNCVRKVNSAGIITTVAGTGIAGYNGDSIAATDADLSNPIDLAIDRFGNLYVTDWYNYRVRKITPAGYIFTVVGNGAIGSTGNHGPATASQLGAPFRVVCDTLGNLYVAEVRFQCICKVDTAGMLTIIADTTGSYALGTDGDGGQAATASMSSPCGLALDNSGYLYFSDIGNNRIRRIDLTTGIVDNYAASGTPGYSGDGGTATAAEMGTLEGLACDASGNLYISDADNNLIRMVSKSTAVITRFAGRNGLFDQVYQATNAEFDQPANIAVDATGNLYVCDFENNQVRKINAVTGAVSTVAGSGIAGYNFGYSGDGGPATDASIYQPYALAFDGIGNMFIADYGNSRIRKVDTNGIITTYAGDGVAGYSGDGVPARYAELYYPTGVAVDKKGNVYIADLGNSRIRMVDTEGYMHTIAGKSTAGFAGDGGPASNAELSEPVDVAVDGKGNIYLTDLENNDIRKIDTSGVINSISLNGAAGFSGDGDSSIYAQVSFPFGLKADNEGNVFFADQGNNRVRMINVFGIINTIAGNGAAGYAGDGGPATAAKLNTPEAVAVDMAGNLYISDGYNDRVRKVVFNYLSVLEQTAITPELKVFPNPASTSITVQPGMKLTGSEQVSVFNTAGQLQFTFPLLLPNQSYNISNLPAGTYFISVAGRNGVSTTKFVKF